LAALYNASKPQGMGFMHYDPTPMSVEQAEKLLNQGTYFDYLMGRVMKIDLSGDTLEPWLYDRDNGEGAAQKALESLQATSNPANPEILHTHAVNTVRSAQRVQSKLGESTKVEDGDGVCKMSLGLSDVKSVLAPKVAKAKFKNKNK